MKNFKKIIACLLSTLVVGSCLSLMSVSADIVYDDVDTYDSGQLGEMNYYLPNDFDIQDVLDDENHTLILNGKVFTLKRIEISTPNDGIKRYDIIDGVIPTIEEDYDFLSYVFFKEGSNIGWFYAMENNDNNELVMDALGIGIPVTEFTVGESTYPRGDINLDGTVNTVDLLMLKKYLLGLMEW